MIFRREIRRRGQLTCRLPSTQRRIVIDRAWEQYSRDEVCLLSVFFAWLSKFDSTPITARYCGDELQFAAEQWCKDWWQQSTLRFALMVVFWVCFWPLWPLWYVFFSGSDFYY